MEHGPGSAVALRDRLPAASREEPLPAWHFAVSLAPALTPYLVFPATQWGPHTGALTSWTWEPAVGGQRQWAH